MVDPQRVQKDDLAPEHNRGIVGSLWGFLRDNRKWWLLPILISFLLFGVLLFLAASGAAPFIYTVF